MVSLSARRLRARELFPYSDIDLLVLYEGGRIRSSTRVVEQVIYPLWDAKVQVGVRPCAESRRRCSSRERNLTVRTSRSDARSLAGNEGPTIALRRRRCAK